MSPSPITRNTLFYGDNLPILRDHIGTESIDLVYLDPPFNSNRSYNVLFKEEGGQEAESQIKAFDDTWHWGEKAEETYTNLLQGENPAIANMISSLLQFIGTNQMMAYLVMMAARLVELRRVLKPTGTLFLHCDPTASHYLKIILDTIFGVLSYRNEIIWQRTSAHANVVKKFGAIHDVLIFYSLSDDYTWNAQFTKYDEEYIETFFDQIDDTGRRYARRDLTASMQRASSGQLYEWKGIRPPPSRCWAMTKKAMDDLETNGRIHWPKKEGGMPRLKVYPEDLPGVPLQDIWSDVKVMHNLSSERLGYPTQKPLALLERIIQACSNPGDVVLDPFCGCGTAIAAAEKLGRRWIGIDITHLAISLIKFRMKDMFPGCQFETIGEPQDLADARQLAHDDRYQFQWWALSLMQARPIGGLEESKAGKKGSDKGMDGIIPFVDDASKKLKRVIVQVKSGHVKSGDIRDLHGVIDREKDAPIGVFLTLEEPTKEMERESVTSGFYTSPLWQKQYPKIQILTIEEVLNGATVKMPPSYGAFKKAEKVKQDEGIQGELRL